MLRVTLYVLNLIKSFFHFRPFIETCEPNFVLASPRQLTEFELRLKTEISCLLGFEDVSTRELGFAIDELIAAFTIKAIIKAQEV